MKYLDMNILCVKAPVAGVATSPLLGGLARSVLMELLDVAGRATGTGCQIEFRRLLPSGSFLSDVSDKARFAR